MPIAEARVTTDRASRYLVQLCRHTGMMRRMRHQSPVGHGGGQMPDVRHVEWSDTHGTVRFTEGEWNLEAEPDALTLRVRADDEEALQRLKTGITVRLEKIGRRDGLTVTWQHPPATPAPPTGERPGTARPAEGGKGRIRSVTKVAGVLAVGAVVVALHLGVVGAALTVPSWTGWAAGGVLALVVLKILFVSGHVLLGRASIRRGRAFLTQHGPGSSQDRHK
ncbi:DUF2218 domain-containing protein [Streptomyces sp. CA-142005]|uniref:DUF2218 domain-containing protein n=1 Tax=Streptomyces sp. CA-142005 TaxID=3240052 RepID=UPI003D934868